MLLVSSTSQPSSFKGCYPPRPIDISVVDCADLIDYEIDRYSARMAYVSGRLVGGGVCVLDEWEWMYVCVTNGNDVGAL